LKHGDVVVNVPLDLCQIIQFDCGSAGIEKQDGVPLSELQRRQLLWVVEFFLSAELLSALTAAAPSEDAIDSTPLGSAAFWSSYGALLKPAEEGLPLLLPPDELARLKEAVPDVIGTLEAHRARIQEAWGKQFGGMPPASLFTANALVMSRCFCVWNDDQGAVLALVAPFADMLNHSDLPNCRIAVEGNAVKVLALRDIAQGEECFISYSGASGKSAVHMWFRYGFCPAPSSDDPLSLDPAVLAAGPALRRAHVAAFVAAHPAHAAAAASTPQRKATSNPQCDAAPTPQRDNVAASIPQRDAAATSTPQRDDVAASTPQRDAPADMTGEERAEEAGRARALAAACEALLEAGARFDADAGHSLPARALVASRRGPLLAALAFATAYAEAILSEDLGQLGQDEPASG
jgi:hypothetical protein